MIKLNLCGKYFGVPSSILKKSELFYNMLNDVQNDGNPIVIDRSPKLFEHVLALLIDDNYLYPQKYAKELDYYLVKCGKLYDPNEEIKNKINRIDDILNKNDFVECCHDNCENNRLNSPACDEHVGMCAYSCSRKGCDSRFYTDRCYNSCDKSTKYCELHDDND
jgi:hypothetical protein